MRQLTFYFDFISHNAYLAWKELLLNSGAYGCRLEPVPVLFAAFLKSTGQLGPAEIPAKRDWMLLNVLRKADDTGLRISPPASHPFNPLPALRAATAATAGDTRIRVVDALFDAAWAESRDVGDADVVRAVCDECGVDAAAIERDARSDSVKLALRQVTDAAIINGVFGVPTMRVDGQLFWGYDDLPYLRRYLAGETLRGPDSIEGWKSVQPSVSRKR